MILPLVGVLAAVSHGAPSLVHARIVAIDRARDKTIWNIRKRKAAR